MENVTVYQIGLGSFGRHGFEKLLEIAREFKNVELGGVCEKDFEKLERADKFAKANGLEVETFQKVDEMYSEAARQPSKVMIYDAGPTENHASHIYRSMENDFFHLTEKPPSMNRGEHMREKKLAKKGKAMWKCDFIERENPAVKKALEIMEGEEIESIRVYRESSVGVEKAINSMERIGVKGGDILDKMIHEAYLLDFIEQADETIELELQNVKTKFFQPKGLESEKFADIYSGYVEEINYETATAMTRASLKSGEVDIKLYSSWLGLSEETMIEAKQLEASTGHKFTVKGFSEIDGKAFLDEEARFMVIHGGRELAVDMLEGKVFDLESGSEIETENYLHDPLYRVIESAVFQAAGRDREIISEKEIDVFMNAIFDVKESVETNRDYYREMGKVNEKLEKMIVEDRKVLEAEESETIAG